MDDNRFFVTETPNTRPRFTIQVANALYESKRRDISNTIQTSFLRANKTRYSFIRYSHRLCTFLRAY